MINEVPTTVHEYQDKVSRNLNVIEKMISKTSSTDERIDVTNLLLIQLIKSVVELLKLNSLPLGFENPSEFSCHREIASSANIGKQLPDVEVPYDMQVVIKALSTNTGTTYIGNTKTDSEDTSKSFPLSASEALMLKVKNLNCIWFSVSVAGEGLTWAVEQIRKD